MRHWFCMRTSETMTGKDQSVRHWSLSSLIHWDYTCLLINSIRNVLHMRFRETKLRYALITYHCKKILPRLKDYNCDISTNMWPFQLSLCYLARWVRFCLVRKELVRNQEVTLYTEKHQLVVLPRLNSLS